MKKLITTTLLLGYVVFGLAQTYNDASQRPLNTFNLNLLGDASLASIHYERLLEVDSTFLMAFKLGLGFNRQFRLCLFGPCSSPANKYLTVPMHVTANAGGGRNFFEFGVGVTLIRGKTPIRQMSYGIIGYRLQPLESNKNVFRVFAQLPFSGFENEDILFIPLGFSFGGSF